MILCVLFVWFGCLRYGAALLHLLWYVPWYDVLVVFLPSLLVYCCVILCFRCFICMILLPSGIINDDRRAALARFCCSWSQWTKNDASCELKILPRVDSLVLLKHYVWLDATPSYSVSRSECRHRYTPHVTLCIPLISQSPATEAYDIRIMITDVLLFISCFCV